MFDSNTHRCPRCRSVTISLPEDPSTVPTICPDCSAPMTTGYTGHYRTPAAQRMHNAIIAAPSTWLEAPTTALLLTAALHVLRLHDRRDAEYLSQTISACNAVHVY